MPVRKMTPVLVVERIEPSLALWVDRLGFDKTMEVPEGVLNPSAGRAKASPGARRRGGGAPRY